MEVFTVRIRFKRDELWARRTSLGWASSAYCAGRGFSLPFTVIKYMKNYGMAGEQCLL